MVGRKLKDDRGVTRYAMSTTQTDQVIKDRQLDREVLATTVDRLLTKTDNSRRQWRFVLASGAALSILIAMSAVSSRPSRPPVSLPIQLLGPIGIVLMFAAIITHKRYRWSRNDLRPFALCKLGYCTCCGYPLDGLAPDPDGCTVCPECGAAWRFELSAPANLRDYSKSSGPTISYGPSGNQR